MSHVQFTDELVREYLLFRGFGGTLKAFDNDLKIDKDKGFRVDKIVDQLLQCIYNYDLNGLRDVWNHLDSRLFSRLEQHFAPAIKKLENGVLKFYLVYASENNKQDKITDFFSKLTSDLVGQSEWKDWFVLPYVKNPEENPTFAVYFTKQWQDTLFVSLHNFLSAVYQCMPQPTISNFEENATKIQTLQKENEMLKKGLANLISSDESGRSYEVNYEVEAIMDDFYNISQEIRTAGNQTKILKTLMRNISSSPKTSTKVGTSSASQALASRGDHKKQSSKKVPSTKRSVSIDARPSSTNRQRERDSSLDVLTQRTPKKDRDDTPQEPGFLCLSQEEYNDHKVEVTCMKFNTRGSIVASSDIEGNLKVWTVAPVCKTTSSFSVKCSLLCLDWVPSHERYLVCGGSDGVMRLFDIKEGKLMWELEVVVEGHSTGSSIEEVVCSPTDSSIIIISGGKMFSFDLKTRTYEKTINARHSCVSCCINHNGTTLVAGLMDGCLCIIDLKKNEILEVTECSRGPIIQVQFTRDYTAYYALTHDKKLWFKSLAQTKDKNQVYALPGEESKPSGRGNLVSLDNSGTFLLTAFNNSGVIYKIQELTLSKSLELGGHKSPLTCVDWFFANQCGTCVTASHDGKVRVSTLLVDNI